MKKWKFGRTYVYYVPEYDFVYTASYLPPNPKMKKDVPSHTFCTLRHFPEGILDTMTIYLNPDVLITYPHKYPFTVTVHKTVYIGEL